MLLQDMQGSVVYTKWDSALQNSGEEKSSNGTIWEVLFILSTHL